MPTVSTSFLVTSSQLTDIASAIRSKNGESALYTVDQMPSKILAIAGGGGVIPTGTLDITSNGIYNVYNYASASVSVPGIIPTGTSEVILNGTYDIYSYSSVSVNVPNHPYAARYTDNADFISFEDTSVTTIPYGTFAYTLNLSSVNFPEATTVGSYAFGWCFKLNSVSFPKVKTISNYAFNYCSSLFSGQNLTSTQFPSLTGTLGAYAFRGCQYLTGVSLPNITSVGAQCFSACSRIKFVSLPSCKVLSAGAFSYLTTCTDYSLPSVSLVGSSAFYSNWALTTLSLPSASTISGYAFRYCSKLMSIYLMGSTVVSLPTSTTFENMPVKVSVNNVYGSVYVPSSLYATYIAKTNWTTISARIVSV